MSRERCVQVSDRRRLLPRALSPSPHSLQLNGRGVCGAVGAPGGMEIVEMVEMVKMVEMVEMVEMVRGCGQKVPQLDRSPLYRSSPLPILPSTDLPSSVHAR